MRSRFRVAGHPAHPMLVMFPVALLPLMLVLDAIHWTTGEESAWTAGFWVAVVGVVMTVIAIVPGVVDMSTIPNGTRAHRTALFHAIVGGSILAVYAAAVWARWPAGSGPDDFGLAAGIDVLGTLLVTVQGWLGGELVYRHHVGVRTPEEGGDPVVLTGTESTRGARGGARRPGL